MVASHMPAKRWQKVLRNWRLYLLLLPVVVYFVLFHYLPMYGLTLAFKEYDPRLSIFGNDWVGLKYFTRFFSSYGTLDIILNTLALSVYGIVAGFPVPIVLSLLLNEVRSKRYKKIVQTVTYAPHFISTVVFVSMITTFLNPSSGIINILRNMVGLESVHFMQYASYFNTIYVVSGIWQGAGWGCVIYIAALSAVDPDLYEAGYIDGMNRLQKLYYIDFMTIRPTISIMLILSAGGIMSVGFEKVWLMQNNLNISSSQVISTYVYNVGLQGNKFSYATAIGLFNSVVCFLMLVGVNLTVRKTGGTSLW